MKKAILFTAVIAAFSFASCKKDHTCTCTQTSSDGSPTFTYVATVTKAKKSDVKKQCINSTETNSGVVYTTTCTLK